jgi:serine phosphatase RsbU (regulator of sigma subunit)
MLLPFLLAATADSLDTILSYAAGNHWIPERFAFHGFHLGPIEFPLSTASYTVFLFSLLAVIFYRFIHVSQEEQRTSAEIEAARSVQAMLIPTQLPSNHNFMLESAYLPANGVGGDFFQVLPLQDDSMLIVVGDVSGKGLKAAMTGALAIGALRTLAAEGLSPGALLARLNSQMLAAQESGFITCLCMRISPQGAVALANAGHLSPYLRREEVEVESGLPLGVAADQQYGETTLQLEPGQSLTLLSDGVVEAMNAQKELFGFERTRAISAQSAHSIAEAAQQFGQDDDITVLTVKRRER